MANALFTAVKKKILDQDTGLDFLVDTIKVSLIDTADDDPNVASDDFFDDIVAAAVEETATLSSKTTTGGAFDSANPTFTGATGDPCEELLLWSDTAGASSTDPLIASYDSFGSGMPVTPNGGDIIVDVHANGWFSL